MELMEDEEVIDGLSVGKGKHGYAFVSCACNSFTLSFVEFWVCNRLVNTFTEVFRTRIYNLAIISFQTFRLLRTFAHSNRGIYSERFYSSSILSSYSVSAISRCYSCCHRWSCSREHDGYVKSLRLSYSRFYDYLCTYMVGVLRCSNQYWIVITYYPVSSSRFWIMEVFLRKDGKACGHYVLLLRKLNVRGYQTECLKHRTAAELKNDLKLLTVFFAWKKRPRQLLKILIRGFTNLLEVIKICISCFAAASITGDDVGSGLRAAMRFLIVVTVTTKQRS